MSFLGAVFLLAQAIVIKRNPTAVYSSVWIGGKRKGGSREEWGFEEVDLTKLVQDTPDPFHKVLSIFF